MNVPGRMSQPVNLKRRATFATREEITARRHNTGLPYFRLDDSLCKRFLELATDPGDFEGLKLLFPFVREMSLLRCERSSLAKLDVWMQLAFMAGHDLGRAHPERVEDVLRGHELQEAARRLGVLGQSAGEEHLTLDGLRRACVDIVKAKWADAPQDRVLAVFLEAVLKTLRVGFAAATSAQCDPRLCELVWDIPDRIGEGIADIVTRVLVGAPLRSVGKPLLSLMEHPVIRLAREYYRGEPIQAEMALGFMRDRLRDLGVRSENECPTSDADLLDWVAAGLEYGRQVKIEQPELLDQMFMESGECGLNGATSAVQRVVAEAGGTDPVRLLGPLKAWQQNVYGWAEPKFYGEALARVVYFADFAIWIPFLKT